MVSLLEWAVDPTLVVEDSVGESRELRRAGQGAVLMCSRWMFLKRVENLTEKPGERLAENVRHNLRMVRAYLLKEEFQLYWEYHSPGRAVRLLDLWCEKTLRLRIEPMKKVARMARSHRELIGNWFRARKAFSSGVVEGLNNQAK